MLRASTITKDMHDAARDFQAQFTIACYDYATFACRSISAAILSRGSRAELTETQTDARRRVDEGNGRARRVSAVRPAGASGMSSGCSTRSASGRCGKAGAARPVRVEQAQGILVAGLRVLAGWVRVWVKLMANSGLWTQHRQERPSCRFVLIVRNGMHNDRPPGRTAAKGEDRFHHRRNHAEIPAFRPAVCDSLAAFIFPARSARVTYAEHWASAHLRRRQRVHIGA